MLRPNAAPLHPPPVTGNWSRVPGIIITAVVVYLLLVALGRLLQRRFGTQLGRTYQLFCAVAGPYVATSLQSGFPVLHTALGAATVLLGTGVLIRLIDQYFWKGFLRDRRKTPVPKFVRDVVAALLLLIVALRVLDYGYDVHVPHLLAASGVIGIILGFAMQDLLGNIIAGFALQLGRPFKVGDWLLIDNQHVQAVEINWRSSRFITNDEIQLDVPNQHIVRQVITNYHGGGPLHAFRFEVSIDYDAPPNQVKDLLMRAASSAAGVRAEPQPTIYLKSFGECAISYEVRVWIDDHRQLNTVADAVRTNIWYALRRNHIKIPFPVRRVLLERTRAQPPAADRQKMRRASAHHLLHAQPLFKTMSDEHLRMLVDRSPAQQYGRGESIIREGAQGDSMFVLLDGEAGVTVNKDNQSTRVATLRGGDCFGEMSLLTGEKRSARVLAVTDCEVLEITKPVFAEIVALDRGLLARLSELLASRQLETEGIVAARTLNSGMVAAKEKEYQAGFLRKLTSFFDL